MTGIHLLLTPDNEHNKVYRDVPIIGFRRAKSLKDCKRFANILYLLEILHHLLQDAHMRLDQKI